MPTQDKKHQPKKQTVVIKYQTRQQGKDKVSYNKPKTKKIVKATRKEDNPEQEIVESM